jgi:high-affinity nickel permease
VDFHVPFRMAEGIDSWLASLFSGAPLLVALGIALLLGLRHASDPDHLVAVTSIVAADHGNTRAAARLGVWWGVGHAGMLIVVGLPLILFKSELPAWLESGAEKAVGGVILLLAGRVIAKWVRGDYRLSAHSHTPDETDTLHDVSCRHLRRGSETAHHHRHVRTRRQALAIGILHGLAGTGAVVLLLIAALPTQVEAVAALAIFAPASIVSMTVCTSAFAWVLTRPVIEPVYRAVLIPALGVFGVIFGGWYVGLL